MPNIRIDLAVINPIVPAPAIDALLATVEGGVLIATLQGLVRDANHGVFNFFLQEPNELRGRPLGELLRGFDAPFLDLADHALSGNQRVRVSTVAIRRDQSSLPVEIDLCHTTDAADGTKVMALIIRERSTRQDGEIKMGTAILVREQQLASAAAIAGQIAHDFNNLLTPLIAYPQLIRRSIPQGEPSVEYLDLMEKTANEMAAINQQLMVFARRGLPPCQEVFNVADTIRHVLSTLTWPQNVTVKKNLAAEPLFVKGGFDQVIQALHHLIQNAIEAINGPGTVTIETRALYLDQNAVANFSNKHGEYVRISIVDTGTGIPESIIDRIYDPFFTTKRGGTHRNPGLGLSIAFCAVRDHGGFINLESKAGRGTTFNVYLPLHRNAASKPAATSTTIVANNTVAGVNANQNKTVPGALENTVTTEHHTITALDHDVETIDPERPRILIVDDNKMIRALFNIIVTSEYPHSTIDQSSDGNEAVRMFSSAPYQLIIMDLHMPSMNGLKAFSEISDICNERRTPVPPVIFCTGFLPPDKLKDILSKGSRNKLLRKPVNATDLVKAVRESL